MNDDKTNNSSNGQNNPAVNNQNNGPLNNQNTKPINNQVNMSRPNKNNRPINDSVDTTESSNNPSGVDNQNTNSVNNQNNTVESNPNTQVMGFEVDYGISRDLTGISFKPSGETVPSSSSGPIDTLDNNSSNDEMLDDEYDALEDDQSQSDNDDVDDEEDDEVIEDEDSEDIDELDDEDQVNDEDVDNLGDEENASDDGDGSEGDGDSEEDKSESDEEDDESEEESDSDEDEKSDKDDSESDDNQEKDESDKENYEEDKDSSEEKQNPDENPSTGENQPSGENPTSENNQSSGEDDSDSYKSTSTPEENNNTESQNNNDTNNNNSNNQNEPPKEEKNKDNYTPDEVGKNRGNYQDYQNQQNRYNQEAAARNNYQQTNTRNPNQQDNSMNQGNSGSSGEGLPKKDDDKKPGDKKDSKDKKDTKKAKQANNQKKKKAKEGKDKLKKKEKELLLKYWWVVALAALLFLILFIILLGILGGEEADDYAELVDPEFDFNLTVINITNDYSSSSDKVVLETLTMIDFLEGAAYAQFGDTLAGKSDSEKIAIYEAFYVAAKSIILSLGNYDAATKEITIRSGINGMPYCDVSAGCKIYNNDGVYSYVSANVNKTIKGSVVQTMSPLSSHEISLMDVAFTDAKPMLLVPKSFNGELTKYDFARPPYNSTIKDKIVNSEYTDFKEIIGAIDEYKDFKIYSLLDNTMSYEYTESTAYWWPIGSSSPTSGNIYGGTPTATNITSKFGWRDLNGDGKPDNNHSGIDIANGSCSNVVVATRAGKVIRARGGCATMGYLYSTCNDGYGNFVKIDHGNGIVSVYAHLTKDSITVTEGQTVTQGQKIGIMGSSGSSTGCHLHFEIDVDGSPVDPLQYVSAANTRPSANVTPSYKNGTDNRQSVCLTLKQSGFSNNAVAAIMTNIQAESSFNTGSIGDNGTSYGLCQWHNGRYTNLKNYCGSSYSTVNCQLKFLIYELQNSYQGVYRMLLSNNTASTMSTYYCTDFERPANRNENCPKRTNKYINSMLTYVQNGCK